MKGGERGVRGGGRRRGVRGEVGVNGGHRG